MNDRNLFFRGSSGPLYGVLWEPREHAGAGARGGAGTHARRSGGDAAAGRGVVICDSLFEEKFWCERVLANLSRSLAGDGFTVLSFDYHGYGNSPGDTDVVDVPGLERNIHDACELVRSRGCSRITLLGVRWGAALAERVAAARDDVDSLFLVQPVASWRKTLMAALRGNVAGQYSIFKKAIMTREEIVKELLAGGDCVRSGYRMNNIDGYIVSRDFFVQSEAVSMPAPLRASPPAIVVFDIREGEAPEDPECAALVAAYREAGASCEAAAVTGDNRFWLNNRIFTSTAPNFVREVGARVAAMDSIRLAGGGDGAPASRLAGGSDGAPARGAASFASEHLRGAIADRTRVSNEHSRGATSDRTRVSAILDEISNDGVRETAVRFSAPSGGMMYGVHYAPETPGTTGAGVVFTHGGLIGMNGAFRFNTRAARRIAREGIPCLCFDPHGMGRSPDSVENIDQRQMFRKIQTGLFADDVDRAAAFLQERSGIRDVVVFGVCGGAITNIQAHARSKRIKYSMLLSIPVMLSGLSHEEIRMSEGYARFYLGMYARKIFNPRAWWRFVTFQSEYSMIFKASRLSVEGAARRLMRRKGKAAPAKAAPAAAAAAPDQQASGRKPLSATSSVTGSGIQFNEHFLAAYRAIVARGEKILFVFGENDNFRWEYESAFLEQYPGDVRAGEGIVETEIIPHANHMYTLQEWQQEIMRRCLPRLTRELTVRRS